MRKRIVPIILIFCMLCTCLVIFPESVSAAHKHRYSGKYVKEKHRIVYECTSATAIGGPITGGWIRKSGVQKVHCGERAGNIAGKSFSTARTVSFGVTERALKRALEAKLGCGKTWKNSNYIVKAKKSSRNKTDKARYIAFFIQNKYQKYKMTYRVKNQKYCSACKKWITRSNSAKTTYAYKKVGADGAFFYADKKSYLTAERKVCLYKDGIMYEDYGKEGRGYLVKNGRILTGAANKKKQNYNAFSNIKNWY